MSTVKIAITASSTSKGQRERESKKISCNCFNARLDRESCYSSFRLSNSRAPDFELVLILSPLLPTCMYIHFGCSSLKPGHVTFLNNFPFLDIILPIKKQNLSLLSRSHIPVLFLLLNPIWKYLCTFQVVFNGELFVKRKCWSLTHQFHNDSARTQKDHEYWIGNFVKFNFPPSLSKYSIRKTSFHSVYSRNWKNPWCADFNGK